MKILHKNRTKKILGTGAYPDQKKGKNQNSQTWRISDRFFAETAVPFVRDLAYNFIRGQKPADGRLMRLTESEAAL